MNKFKILLLCASLLLISCAPLKRGMHGNTYTSTAKPSFSLAVPELELRTAGRFNASITTSNALGGVSVDTWIAVYGGNNIDEPMAIVAQSSLNQPYYWDSDLRKIHSINHSKVVLGDFTFQASTYLISDMQRDAFAPLSLELAKLKSNNQDESPVWIVRRFATRMDFDRGKITLEYREKAPDDYIDINGLPFGSHDFIANFEQRALKAFVFGQSLNKTQEIRTDYPNGIHTRYLNTNFFGTISYHDPFD